MNTGKTAAQLDAEIAEALARPTITFGEFKRFKRDRSGLAHRTVSGVGVVYVYQHPDLGAWMWKIEPDDVEAPTVYAQSKYATQRAAIEAAADHLGIAVP